MNDWFIPHQTACNWHFLQAVSRRLGKDADEVNMIKEMQKQTDKTTLEHMLKEHAHLYGANSYFQENYGMEGKVAKPENWAKVYSLGGPETSMVAEQGQYSENVSPCNCKNDQQYYLLMIK